MSWYPKDLYVEVSAHKEVLSLALPAIVSNITVPLLGLADYAMLGHLADVQLLGAISIGSMIFNIIYWVFGFLRMGTSGMTAQAYGAKNKREIGLNLVRAIGVGLLLALCIVLLRHPLMSQALKLMNCPDEALPFAYTYVRILVWGAPAMLGLYALTGWFVGLQNTRVPMWIAIIQNVVNILITFVLIWVYYLDIAGAAIGTLAAQWLGFLLALGIAVKHWRKNGCGKLSLSQWKEMFPVDKMKHFFAVNRDLFLRTLCLVAVNLFFTSVGAQQGTIVLAANTLLMTFFMMFSYIMDGFAHAGEAMAGRYYGGFQLEYLEYVELLLFTWGIVMMIVFTLTYAFGGSFLLNLITDQVDVANEAELYIEWVWLIPFASVGAFIYDGIFIGMTETRGMLVASVIATAVFFILYFLLSPKFGNYGLWIAFVFYLFARSGVQFIWFRHILSNW